MTSSKLMAVAMTVCMALQTAAFAQDAGTCSECGQTKKKISFVTSPLVFDATTNQIRVIPAPKSVELGKVFEVELEEVPEVSEFEAIVVEELETAPEIMVVRPTIGVGSGSCDGCCCCEVPAVERQKIEIDAICKIRIHQRYRSFIILSASQSVRSAGTAFVFDEWSKP